MSYQNGNVWYDKKSRAWFGRYREDVLQPDGTVKRVQRCKKLAELCDRYRCEEDVRPLLDELLRPINERKNDSPATMRFGQFVENVYLPHAVEQKRVSTSRGYHSKWHQYLKPLCSDWWMRDVRTCDVQRVLNTVARRHDLSRATLRHIKALLSGIFNFARQQGYFDGANPVEGVAIPKARAGGETYAYSLEEVTRMIMLLPEPAATIVATAAFTGLRRGEIRGLLWENYSGQELHVTRSICNGVVDEPKTQKSKAPVPVISQLRAMLDAHRAVYGGSGPIFPNHLGKPVCLNNLANRVILPVLQKAGIVWHGWHAFRRGLATNLNRLGVPGKAIQAILRHANLSTTMNVYVKTVEEDSVAAMKMLEAVLCSKCEVNAPATASAQVN